MASTSYILIVEDDLSIRELIAFACAGAGFEVKTCENVQKAQVLIEQASPSLIILDNLLPGKTGIEWLAELRSQDSVDYLPVIMLTALDSEADRVSGLDTGADDYIVKPFLPRELIARIKAILRRIDTMQPKNNEKLPIKSGPFAIDESRHEVRVNGHLLTLSTKEFELLRLFVKNPGRVYTREMLLSLIWKQAYIDERTVDVHVLRLRKQLKAFEADGFLQTVRGIGYKLDTSL